MMIKTMVSGVLTMTPMMMMMMISNFHDYKNNINQTIDIKDKKKCRNNYDSDDDDDDDDDGGGI